MTQAWKRQLLANGTSDFARNGHGAAKTRWVPAGEGIVDWTAIFGELRRTGYDGYVSIHCEYDIDEGADWHGTFVREVAFFRGMRENSEK